MVKHKVLSTKKLKASLIERAKEIGIEVTEAAFIKTEPVAHTVPKTNAAATAIVFTSKNAVEHAAVIEVNKIFCISGATKTAVENKFKEAEIVATADDGKRLAQKILEANIKEVLFFCGNKRRDELPSLLSAAGVHVQEVVVYETIETPVLVDEDFDAVLFFSPSAVSSFFSKNQLKEAAVCFAIGDTTADAVNDFVQNKIVVCKVPTQEEMISEVLRHCEEGGMTDETIFSN